MANDGKDAAWSSIVQVRPGVPVRSPSVPLGFRPAASRVPPTFCHDRSPEPEQPGRCATGNPLQVVLDLAPSAQPAYVSDLHVFRDLELVQVPAPLKVHM